MLGSSHFLILSHSLSCDVFFVAYILTHRMTVPTFPSKTSKIIWTIKLSLHTTKLYCGNIFIILSSNIYDQYKKCLYRYPSLLEYVYRVFECITFCSQFVVFSYISTEYSRVVSQLRLTHASGWFILLHVPIIDIAYPKP